MELGFPSTFMETLEIKVHASCFLLLHCFTSLACIVLISFICLFYLFIAFMYVFICCMGVMHTMCTWRSEDNTTLGVSSLLLCGTIGLATPFLAEPPCHTPHPHPDMEF